MSGAALATAVLLAATLVCLSTQATAPCNVSMTSKDALLALYASTGGNTGGWLIESNWNVTADCCTWVGVDCITGGIVVGLDLNSNQLTGTLPPELCALVNISILDLSYNSISGALPDEWRMWNQLTSLKLNNNYLLNGTLPTSWKNWTSIGSIDVSSNQLVGTLPPEWGGGMNSISTIKLYVNHLQGTFPPEWSGMNQMAQFFVSVNSFTGGLPDVWSAWSDISVFYVNGNSLNGTLPNAWFTMTSLYQAYFYGNKFVGTLPSSWSAMKSMYQFDISSNHFNGTLPATFGNWTLVHDFSVSSNSFSGGLPTSWGVNWTSLASMNVNNNRLSGPLPASWRGMTLSNGIAVCSGANQHFCRKSILDISRVPFSADTSCWSIPRCGWEYGSLSTSASISFTPSNSLSTSATHSLSPPTTSFNVSASVSPSKSKTRSATISLSSSWSTTASSSWSSTKTFHRNSTTYTFSINTTRSAHSMSSSFSASCPVPTAMVMQSHPSSSTITTALGTSAAAFLDYLPRVPPMTVSIEFDSLKDAGSCLGVQLRLPFPAEGTPSWYFQEGYPQIISSPSTAKSIGFIPQRFNSSNSAGDAAFVDGAAISNTSAAPPALTHNSSSPLYHPAMGWLSVCGMGDDMQPYSPLRSLTVVMQMVCSGESQFVLVTLIIKPRVLPLAQAIKSTSEASMIISALSGSVSAGGVTSRMVLLDRLLKCPDPGDSGGGSGGVLEMYMGDPYGEESRGAVVSNSIVLGVAFIVLVAMMLIVKAFTPAQLSVLDAMAMVHLPSAMGAVAAVCVPTTAAAATSLLLYSQMSAGDRVMGTIMFAVTILYWLCCVYEFGRDSRLREVGAVLIPRDEVQVDPLSPPPDPSSSSSLATGGISTKPVWLRRIQYVFAGSVRWKVKDKRWKRKHLLFIQDVGKLWYIALDVGFSIAVGVVGGLPAIGVIPCLTLQCMVVVLYVVQLGITAFLRPQLSPFSLSYALGTAIISAASAAATIAVTLDRFNSSAAFSASVLALAGVGISLFKNGVDIIGALVGMWKLTKKVRRLRDAERNGTLEKVFLELDADDGEDADNNGKKKPCSEEEEEEGEYNARRIVVQLREAEDDLVSKAHAMITLVSSNDDPQAITLQQSLANFSTSPQEEMLDACVHTQMNASFSVRGGTSFTDAKREDDHDGPQLMATARKHELFNNIHRGSDNLNDTRALYHTDLVEGAESTLLMAIGQPQHQQHKEGAIEKPLALKLALSRHENAPLADSSL